jgi:hypothetical protein
MGYEKAVGDFYFSGFFVIPPVSLIKLILGATGLLYFINTSQTPDKKQVYFKIFPFLLVTIELKPILATKFITNYNGQHYYCKHTTKRAS